MKNRLLRAKALAMTIILIGMLMTQPIAAEEVATFDPSTRPIHSQGLARGRPEQARSAATSAPRDDKEAYIASAAYKKTLEIGMVDCVAMALKNNSEIKIEKISPLIEDENVRIQKARFEPSLSFDFTMEDNTDLSDRPLFGPNPSKTRTGTFNFGYDEKFVTGTDVALDFYNTRENSNALPTYQSLNPSFDSLAEITITQPLLKGFGITVNKADFLIAKNNKLKSDQDVLQETIDVLTDVKKAYYNFQRKQEEYKVALASLKLVQELYDIIKEKYAKGLASNVDILQSESEVARTEEGVLAAEAAMKLAEDNLKLITNLVDDTDLWNANVKLLDELKHERRDVNLVEAIKTAFKKRPDYEAAKIDLGNKDISVVFYKNGMLPTLDLIGSYGLNGLGKNYEKDLGHIGGGKYEDWSIGVSVKFPLFKDEDKGNYEKSKYYKEQALIAFKRLEQKIILDVRNAVRDVDIKYRMLEASKKSKDAERENYAAQGTRFRAGLVSTLDIVTYYERLTRAEVNYIGGIIDYNISLLELARAKGTTLVESGVRLEG